jgi:hypothetical protein
MMKPHRFRPLRPSKITTAAELALCQCGWFYFRDVHDVAPAAGVIDVYEDDEGDVPYEAEA